MAAVIAVPETHRPHRGHTGDEPAPHWGSPVTYPIAVVLIAACVSPALYIIVGGFRTNSQITQDPSGWPSPWKLDNYIDVLTNSVFWAEFKNSAISALSTTVGIVVLGLMVSFVIARYTFRGRAALYALFAAGLMFPMTVAITPLYLLVKQLGLTNTLAGIILPQIAFGLPTTVIILVPFLRAIPAELEEAAFIDGASRLGFGPFPLWWTHGLSSSLNEREFTWDRREGSSLQTTGRTR